MTERDEDERSEIEVNDAVAAAGPQLSADWERRERRRLFLLGLAVVVISVQTLAMIAGALILFDLNTLLNNRTPTIQRIDDNEADARCTAAVQNDFLAAVGELIGAAIADDDGQALALARDHLGRATAHVLQLLDPAVDPCVVADDLLNKQPTQGAPPP